MKHLFLNLMVIFVVGLFIGCVSSASDTQVIKNSSEQSKIVKSKEPAKEQAKEPKTAGEEKVANESQTATARESVDATLKVVAGSGNVVGIDLTNSGPVRGVQFTLEGAKITEVRTTSRTPGFLSKFNGENGKVILVSASGDKIAQGTGLIAEIVCDKKSSVSLTGIIVVP